ncbi:GINS complex Sld5 component [Punctularia strigosozonata HHB-11173 SS5]|uniref:DNA replication complex GINS protein SLD5 n=1 Tax=Punctularia strigosozonata (strain HHB-11173) TaxID=741275 RepID=R7S447_PUNST|nr:GINS complex Sld5 component [Punctularia strigosozonata HHB-11173 SS5]EIN04572.1 GINS complex Sld5 component [Punctularia strigosozonata HHB-11173 SS5]
MEKESGVYGGEDGEETEMQQLIRHWMNERQAPDVLPAQDVLLGTMLDRIRRQSDTIALLRSDPDSSEEEHFRIMLAQTEIERVKFVVRSYVRTRLYKIEKYARYLVANPDLQEKLTQIELEHAKTFAKLTEAHFHQSVLQALPEEQRRLTDHVAFMPPMIPEPDKTRAVFVHARTKCPPVRLPDGSALEMQKGQISLTPYYVIEQLLVRGEVELV